MTTLISIAAPLVLGTPSSSCFSSDKEPVPILDFFEKVETYFHDILEIIPDANRDLIRCVVRTTLTKHRDASLEYVLNTVLELVGGPKNDSDVSSSSEDEDQLIECGCCYDAFPFEEMIQCPETHLFCAPCMNTHASMLLSTHNPDICCIDPSGCALPIPRSELKRLLPPKMLDLLERAESKKALEEARLDNLHYCPFCDWACIIEGETRGILKCRNKPDHRPALCEDQHDALLGKKHCIDEAMSRALDMDGSDPNHLSKPSKKCALYDSNIEQRHAEEVRVAGERAEREFTQTKANLNPKKWWIRK
ncbi:hypothetical protein H0H93_002176 [Arthromyces matolae]|nr:hypothetical protein H0H93_002176 [Arthromyces matolae]